MPGFSEMDKHFPDDNKPSDDKSGISGILKFIVICAIVCVVIWAFKNL